MFLCRPPSFLAALTLPAALLGSPALHAQEADVPVQMDGTLDTVVVTGTRSERTLEDAPVRTEVVSRQEIERMQSRTLNEALANVPGLQLRPVTGKAGYEVSMQGLSSEQVLVLIDGLPVSASTGSTVDLSQIATAGIDRIEIVKGALSAQYGSSAMGGVINVITKRPSEGFTGEVGGDVGSYGEQNTSGKAYSLASRRAYAKLNGGTETLRLGLSMDTRDNDGFDPAPDTWTRPGDQADRRQMDARLDWTLTEQAQLTFGYGYFSENAESRYTDFRPGTGTLYQNKSEEVLRNRYTGAFTRSFDSGLKLQLSGVYENYAGQTHKFNQGYATTFDHRKVDMDLQHINLQTDLPPVDLLVEQLWQIGADYRLETLKQTKDGVSELDGPKVVRSSRELFVQGDIFLAPQWELLPGLRTQDDSDFGTHSAYKVNLKGTLLDGSEGVTLSVRAGVGQGYRVPNLKERFFRFDHSSIGYMVVGNPDLKPEDSTSLQAGFQARLQSARYGVLDVDLNVFHNRINNMIQIDEENPESGSGGIDIYTYKNVERAYTQGMEFGMVWRITPTLRFTTNKTWMQTEDAATGKELTRQPAQQGRTGVDWRMSAIGLASTELSVRNRYQSSELANTSGDRSPAWSQWDLSINHDLSRAWRIYAGVDNLTNRQKDFDDDNDFSPTQGRFVYAGARYRF